MILWCIFCRGMSSWEFSELRMRPGMFSLNFRRRGKFLIWKCYKTLEKSRKSSGSVKTKKSSRSCQKTKNLLVLRLWVNLKVRRGFKLVFLLPTNQILNLKSPCLFINRSNLKCLVQNLWQLERTTCFYKLRLTFRMLTKQSTQKFKLYPPYSIKDTPTSLTILIQIKDLKAKLIWWLNLTQSQVHLLEKSICPLLAL